MEKIHILNRKILKLAFFSFVSLYLTLSSAMARPATHRVSKKASLHKIALTHHVSSRHIASHRTRHSRIRSRRHHHTQGHVIQCVAFARSASDVQLRGNARDWWNNAEGKYERGNVPEANSVLSFRSTRKMPLGHVAVVKQVVDSRTIIIDQSHWAQRGISRNTPVIDVSANNDWSAVRVGMNGNKNAFGSIYPTHGFIYAANTRVHSSEVRQPRNTQNAVHTWTADAATPHTTEVALSPNISNEDLFGSDAPNRSLR